MFLRRGFLLNILPLLRSRKFRIEGYTVIVQKIAVEIIQKIKTSFAIEAVYVCVYICISWCR